MSDTVDRATEAMRGEAVPNGPPADVLSATIAAAETRAKTLHAERRRRIMRIVRYGAWSGLAAAAIVTAVVLEMGGGTASALAQAADNVSAAKSVKLSVTYRMGDKVFAQWVVYLHERRGRKEGPGETIEVRDWNTGRQTDLNLKNKTATQRALTTYESKVEGTLTELSGLGRQIEGLRDAVVTPLGEQQVGDRIIVGYRVKGHRIPQVPGSDFSVWVDPVSHQIVRMEREHPGKPSPVTSIVEFSDWNAKFDPKLFNLDVPDGYKLVGPDKPAGTTDQPSEPADDSSAPPRTMPVVFRQAVEKAAKSKSVRYVMWDTFAGNEMPKFTYFLTGNKRRVEVEHVLTRIDDGKTELILSPYDPVCWRKTLPAQPPRTDSRVQELLANLRVPLDQNPQDLGKEDINGKTTNKYVVKGGKVGPVTGDFTCWLDPATDLPVRIHVEYPSTTEKSRPSTKTFDQIVWNEDFDPKLFNTDVPDGYRVLDTNPPSDLPNRSRAAFINCRRAIDNASKAKSVRVRATKQENGKWVDIQTITRHGDLVRMDKPGSTVVVDLKTFDALALYAPPAGPKTAKREKLEKEAATFIGNVTASLGDIKADLSDGDEKAVKNLGFENIGELKTLKWEGQKEVTGKPSITWTLWTDPETRLPVRVEIVGRFNVVGKVGLELMRLRMDFDKWDEEFDEKLFRFDVPEGYKLEQPKPDAGKAK